MKKLIWFFLILLFSICLGLAIQQDPGYVLLTYRHWSLETSIWIAGAFLLLCLIALHLIFKIGRRTLSIPGSLQRWSSNRKRDKALQQLNLGTQALIEGRFEKAEKLFTDSIEANPDLLCSYSSAAQAAQAQQQYSRRDQYLNQAHLLITNATLAIGITQTQLQIEAQQWEQALATLQHLQPQYKNHRQLLQQLTTVLMALNDWEQLETLLPSLKKNSIFSADAYQQLETDILQHQLQAQDSLKTLQDCWNTLSQPIRLVPEMTATYAKKLIQWDECDAAQKALEQSLKKTLADTLLRLYEHLPGNQTQAQIVMAEKWLKNSPEHKTLLLTLSRLCGREGYQQKSWDYAQLCQQHHPCLEAQIILTDILLQQGDPTAAMTYLQQAIAE